LCRKLKTIKVEVRSGNGITRYTYKTLHWPNTSNVNGHVHIQDILDDFHPQHTLSQIVRGSLNLCSMNQQNREIWGLIFNEIEEEKSL